MLVVVLALLAALSNAAASVLQRRAAADEPEGGPGVRQAVRWLGHVLRRPYWLAGAGMLALSTVLQAAALSVGSLALVQPLMAAELLFTLVVGSVVFHRRPDRRTWLAFVALAAGLAAFLISASPTAGRDTASAEQWLLTSAVVLSGVVVLVLAARPVRGAPRAARRGRGPGGGAVGGGGGRGGGARRGGGAPRAALLGLASAVSFSLTAALLKEVTGRLPDGPAAVLGTWPVYATAVAGGVAFLLLQSAFRAGTLAASQPALTLGDALTSVGLGWALFGEQITLGVRTVPALVGVVLMGAGTAGLARAPSVAGDWDSAARRPGAGPTARRVR
ncbi:DMT family transporter [Streptomyces pilosus]